MSLYGIIVNAVTVKFCLALCPPFCPPHTHAHMLSHNPPSPSCSPELPWLSMMPQTPALPSSDPHPLNSKPSRKPSIAFENMIAEELAETLLAIDMKYFRRITVSVCVCVTVCDCA